MIVRVPSPGAIRAARRNAGVSREELAAEIGVAYTTVASWEQGRKEPRRICMKALAYFFDVDEDDLCEDWDDAEGDSETG